MLKFGLSAALLLAATPALAQQDASSPQGVAVQQAAQAFGQCVGTGIRALPATVSPEAGATTIAASCGVQRQALEAAAEAMIASPAVPVEGKAAAREQLRAGMAGVQVQIADGIRRSRTAAAAPSAANPPAAPAQPH